MMYSPGWAPSSCIAKPRAIESRQKSLFKRIAEIVPYIPATTENSSVKVNLGLIPKLGADSLAVTAPILLLILLTVGNTLWMNTPKLLEISDRREGLTTLISPGQFEMEIHVQILGHLLGELDLVKIVLKGNELPAEARKLAIMLGFQPIDL